MLLGEAVGSAVLAHPDVTGLRLDLRSYHHCLLVIDYIFQNALPVKSGEKEGVAALGQPKCGLGVAEFLVLALHPYFQRGGLVPEAQRGSAEHGSVFAVPLPVAGKEKDASGSRFLLETHLTSR